MFTEVVQSCFLHFLLIKMFVICYCTLFIKFLLDLDILNVLKPLIAKYAFSNYDLMNEVFRLLSKILSGTQGQIQVCLFNMFSFSICMYVYLCVCICVFVCVLVCVFMCVCMCVCMCVYGYAYDTVCMCMFMCIVYLVGM